MKTERGTAAAKRRAEEEAINFEQDRQDFERIGGMFFSRTAGNARRFALWKEWERDHPGYCKVICIGKNIHIRKP